MACIYGIRDTVTGELVYVGQTTRFKKRKQEYLRPGAFMKHHIICYMRSFDDWQERFDIYQVRACSILSLGDFEKYYIQTLNPTQNRHRPEYIHRKLLSYDDTPDTKDNGYKNYLKRTQSLADNMRQL
jgi:hypothetical protein